MTGLAFDITYRFEVAYVNGSGKGPPCTIEKEIASPKASVWWCIASWILLALILLAAGLCGAGALWWSDSHGQQLALYSCALASAVLFLALLMPALADGTRFGVWSLVIGTDKRVSTSQTQIFLWTLLVGFVLVYFTSRTWFGGVQHLFDGIVPGGNNAGTGSAWPDYLILLGGRSPGSSSRRRPSPPRPVPARCRRPPGLPEAPTPLR